MPRIVMALVMAVLAHAAQARTLVAEAERVTGGGIDARQVHIELDESHARVVIQALRAPQLGLDGHVEWACALRAAAHGRACDGTVRLRRDDGVVDAAGFGLVLDGHGLDLTLRDGVRSAVLTIPFTDSQPYVAALRGVPAAWLRAPLAAAWPQGELREGRIDLDATRAADGRTSVQYQLEDLAFDAADGTVAAQSLAAKGRLDATSDGRVVVAATLGGGQLQVGTLHVELPPTPVSVELDVFPEGDFWRVARFAWRDPGALELEASGELAPAADAPLRRFDARLVRATLPLALDRYARGPLAAAHLEGLAARGEAAGVLEMIGPHIEHLRLESPALAVTDAERGIRLSGIHGAIDWSPTGVQPPATLGWTRAQFAGVALPGTNARWQSRGGALHLQGALKLAFAHGRVELRDSVLRPLEAASEPRFESAFDAHALDLESSDGRFAAAKFSARGSARLFAGTQAPRLLLDARLAGGELLAGPMYVSLPPTGIATALDLTVAPGHWQVARFEWSDPGTLEVSARADIVPQSPAPLASLELDLRRVALAPALERYGHSWLAARGYPALRAGGSLSGTLDFGPDGLRRFDFTADKVDLDDGGGRFRIDGLDGRVGWDPAHALATTLGWRSAQVFAIPFGAARAELVSDASQVALKQPLAIDVLGGKLQLERFSLQPRSPRGQRYAASFAIVGIEMAQLSAALGWPRFGGSLSGGVPEVEFAGDRIDFNGGLDLYVFDGHVGISGMSLERPFGVAPALGADIHFENVDLEQLTGAFSLGSISGRLLGTIQGLRLLDWSPVAFDAWLRTDGGGRLSYQAVNELTTIGGGGLSGGLQTMALGLFHTFGYRRIGLRCRLENEVCLMGGIDPLPADAITRADDPAGYTIAEGAGIPRLDIVGHGRRVDWPTLVRRVEEATHGQGPVVR